MFEEESREWPCGLADRSALRLTVLKATEAPRIRKIPGKMMPDFLLQYMDDAAASVLGGIESPSFTVIAKVIQAAQWTVQDYLEKKRDNSKSKTPNWIKGVEDKISQLSIAKD